MNFFYEEKEWIKNDNINYFNPSIFMGYLFQINDKSCISPFVNIGISAFIPSHVELPDIDENKKRNIGPELSVSSGFDFIYYFQSSKRYEINSIIETNWKVKLKPGWVYPTFYNTNSILKGNFLYFALCLGADFGTYNLLRN